MNNEPLVSICVPVYNSEKTIRKTIESITRQKYTKIEILVIDNNSSDSSAAIVQEFDDHRIKLILHDVHLPCAEYNWNRCFQYVKGDYMAIFHADDVYSPDIVFEQIEAFSKYKHLSAVFTRGHLINEDDEIIGQFNFPKEVSEKIITYRELLPLVLENYDFLPTPTAMIPTHIYKKLAPFKYESFKSASDFDMWLRTADIQPIIILEKKLFNYRISKNQGSFSLDYLRIEEADYFKVLDYHIAKSQQSEEVSQASISKYELFRLDDILKRSRNMLILKDRNNYISILKSLPWKKHLIILIKYPQYMKWVCGSYFRLLINPITHKYLSNINK